MLQIVSMALCSGNILVLIIRPLSDGTDDVTFTSYLINLNELKHVKFTTENVWLPSNTFHDNNSAVGRNYRQVSNIGRT